MSILNRTGEILSLLDDGSAALSSRTITMEISNKTPVLIEARSAWLTLCAWFFSVSPMFDEIIDDFECNFFSMLAGRDALQLKL